MLLHSPPKASGSWPSWHGMNPAWCQLISWGHLHVPSPIASSAVRCAHSNSQGLCLRNINGWGYTTCHTLATLYFNEELFSDSTRETVGISTSKNVGEWNLKQNLAACKLLITWKKKKWAGLPLNHCGVEIWSCLLSWPLPDLLCLTFSWEGWDPLSFLERAFLWGVYLGFKSFSWNVLILFPWLVKAANKDALICPHRINLVNLPKEAAIAICD